MIPSDPPRIVRSPKVNAAFEDLFIKLVKQEPIKCLISGIEHPAIKRPDVAVLDVCALQSLLLLNWVSRDRQYLQTWAYTPLKFIQKYTGKQTQTFGWYSASVASVFYMLGPSELGGRLGGLKEKAEALALKTGQPLEDCYDEVSWCLRVHISAK